MEEKLIAAVYKRRAIWDPNDELRKNSQILKKMWAEISIEIGVEISVAKNRWKNLRAYFLTQQRELEKPRPSSNGSIKTMSTWTYYNQLMFLKDVMTNEKKDDSLTVTKEEDLYYSQGDETYNEFEEESFSNPPMTEILYPEKNLSINIIPETEPSISQSETRRKLVSESDEMEYSQIHYGKRQKIEEKREIQVEENPDLLFFRSLIPYMEDFTPVQKLRLRSKIQNLIVLEFETMQGSSSKGYSNTSRSSATPYQSHTKLRPTDYCDIETASNSS